MGLRVRPTVDTQKDIKGRACLGLSCHVFQSVSTPRLAPSMSIGDAESHPNLAAHSLKIEQKAVRETWVMQILASLNIGAWAYMMMPLSPEQEEIPKLQVGS